MKDLLRELKKYCDDASEQYLDVAQKSLYGFGKEKERQQEFYHMGIAYGATATIISNIVAESENKEEMLEQIEEMKQFLHKQMEKQFGLHIGDRCVFNSPYDQYQARNKQECVITRIIDEDDEEHDISEVGTMYVVRFNDGEEIEAWNEEIHLMKNVLGNEDA